MLQALILVEQCTCMSFLTMNLPSSSIRRCHSGAYEDYGIFIISGAGTTIHSCLCTM